ncbi:hypothetical protein E4T56_gene17581, partial [Termitomyces sp. T112]
QLEEEIGAARRDGQIADFIHDQQRSTGVEADFLGQSPLALGLGKRLDQLGQRAAVDTAPGPDGSHADGSGQMGFSRAGRPEKMKHFGPVDKLELRQRGDAMSVERRLEGEVEAFNGFDRQETRGAQRHADAPPFAQVQFLGQQIVDGLDGADLTFLQPAQRFAGYDRRRTSCSTFGIEAGQAFTHGAVEGQRTLKGLHVGRRGQHLRGFGWQGLAVSWLDTFAVLAFDHRMSGDELPFLEDPHLVGMVLAFDHPAAGGNGHAVRIASHGHPDFPANPQPDPYDGPR